MLTKSRPDMQNQDIRKEIIMRILLAEDDKNLNETLKYHLEREGYTVDASHTGEDALYYIEQHTSDLILLDRMLPGYSGTELLKKLRDSGDAVPVLLLTAMGALHDKVEGLDLGADDYLVKPFAIEELMARIRSLSRRQTTAPISTVPALIYEDLVYREPIGELTGPGGVCTLSKREGGLLEVFLRNPNQTLSRGQLLTKVWGIETEVEDGNLDNYIFFIRRRLKSVSSKVTIHTVRGIGYRIQ